MARSPGFIIGESHRDAVWIFLDTRRTKVVKSEKEEEDNNDDDEDTSKSSMTVEATAHLKYLLVSDIAFI